MQGKQIPASVRLHEMHVNVLAWLESAQSSPNVDRSAASRNTRACGQRTGPSRQRTPYIPLTFHWTGSIELYTTSLLCAAVTARNLANYGKLIVLVQYNRSAGLSTTK